MAIVRDDNYFVIYGWMTKQLHLSGNQLLVYALIYNFNKTTNSIFYGSNDYMKQWFGIGSRNTIASATKKLAEAKLIFKKQLCFQGRLHNFYWINNAELPQCVDKVTLNNTNVTISTTLLADLKSSTDSLPIIEESQALGMNESKNDSVPVNFSPSSAQNLCTKGSKVVHNNNSDNYKEIKNKINYKTRRKIGNFNQKTSSSIYENAIDFNELYN